MADTTFIYGLIDPRTQELRYVGKANNLHQRIREHRKDKNICHRTSWIKSLRNNGEQPDIFVIEEVKINDWQQAERFWISYFRFVGCNLTNSTDGGDGMFNPTAETRAKMSVASKGRKLSDEHKAAISKFHRGRIQSVSEIENRTKALNRPEVKDKMRAAKLGKSLTPAQYAGLFNHPVHKHSEETKNKIRIAKKNCSSETRKLLSIASTGKRHNAETREKIRQIMIARPVSINAKISLTLTGRKASLATRNKMSITRKGKKLPPRSIEYREKMRIRIKAYYEKRKSKQLSLLSVDE